MKYQAEIAAARQKRPEGVHVSCEPQVGELLYALIRLAQPGVAVELGVFLGYSSYYMLSALAANGRGKLYAVDREDCGSGVQNAPECVFIQGDSRAVVPGLPMMDFVFIDSDHSYNVTRAETDLLLPKLNPGAVLVFHDASFDGVAQVVAELPPQFQRISLPTPVLPDRALIRGRPSGLAVVRFAGVA